MVYQAITDYIPRADGTAVALGYFDGVHRGHRAVLKKCAENRGGLRSVALTFAENPAAALGKDGMLEVSVSDAGKGIGDIQQAMQPFFTTQPEKERSGMGFSVMQTFMDRVTVESAPGEGTTVRMQKRLRDQ